MKRLLKVGIVALILISTKLDAQAPQGINYQGVARGMDGQPLSNKYISIRISILSESSSGPVEYEEVHEVKTNSFGLFTLVIGKGTRGTYDFNFIGWTTGQKWLQIEMDENGGSNFKLMGSQQLMSVPYALYAERAGNGYQAGQGIVISNNMISNAGDGDNDSTNELISGVTLGADNKLRITDAGGTKEADLSGLLGASQNLSHVLTEGNSAGNSTITNLGTPVSSSDAATKAYVDAHTDADASVTNELQNLGQVLSQGNDAGGLKIENVGTPTVNSDAATKSYVDAHTDGDANPTNEIQNLSEVLTQSNDAAGSKITNLGTPTVNTDAATKAYVDAHSDGDANPTNEIQNLSEVLTQNNDAAGYKITNLGAPTVNTDAATKAYVDAHTDGDASPSNELQSLSNSVSGTNRTINISGGSGTTIDVADNDNNSTNEIQDLSLSGNTLSLSGDATSVNLASYLDNTDSQTLNYNSGSKQLSISGGNTVNIPETQNLSQVLVQGNSAGSNAITSLADPTNAQDAATKKYVDDADAVLSARISTTYAFKASFNYVNSSGGLINQTMPFVSEDFDDFNVIGANSFTATEDGTYLFTVEGFYNASSSGATLSLLYNSVYHPITIVQPWGAVIPRFSATFLFKLTAGQTVTLVGENIAVSGQFNGKFSGFKL